MSDNTKCCPNNCFRDHYDGEVSEYWDYCPYCGTLLIDCMKKWELEHVNE